MQRKSVTRASPCLHLSSAPSVTSCPRLAFQAFPYRAAAYSCEACRERHHARGLYLAVCIAPVVLHPVFALLLVRRIPLALRAFWELLLRSRSFLQALMTCCQYAFLRLLLCWRSVASRACFVQAVAAKVKQLDLGAGAEGASVEKMVAAARKGH